MHTLPRRSLGLVSLLCACILSPLWAALPNIEEKTKDLRELPGFQTLYWDEQQGKLWLKITHWNEEFLYLSSLPAGIGSNNIGLDRGQLGVRQVVRWERVGPRVLLMATNYGYRADSDNPSERKAVRESFAESALWGFDVAAQTGSDVLVDATNFFLRDVHHAAERLERAKQGSWHVDLQRSAFYLPRTKSFPQNSEVEVTLTLTGGPAGAWLRSVSPGSDAVTVREHHSFVQLPDNHFKSRAFDPRSGFYPTSWYDYATPIDQPVVKRFIARHRIEKKDPSAALGDPVKPIIYYLDRGAPEPIRTALMEGARWWSQAFEAAGFRNGFQVELLPEDADPMDVRYNVIQWVHRSTRGWSYGASIVDPRTGEIIKGQVTLGSLRVRQDYLIATSYLSPFEDGKSVDPRMMRVALARLRQLAAHEVGHTLGLQHNYIASTRNRSSVMDYPPPVVNLKNGVPDFSSPYAVGIGEWDKVAIRWGYGEFGEGAPEKDALDGVIADALKRDLPFLTDQDARPEGSSDPDTHLWDSGANAVDELNRMMSVRAAGLKRFGMNAVRPGDPLAFLEDTLVPLYFGHRYQVEAAVKSVGGLRYRYALRGDGQTPTEFVPPAAQRKALDAVLATLDPQALTIDEKLIALIPPRPSGYDEPHETFNGRTGLVFDPVAAAETAADIVASLLLHPERATRLVNNHARNAQQPALEEILDRTIARTIQAQHKQGLEGEVQRAVDGVVVRRLISLAAAADASDQARAVALARLAKLKTALLQADADSSFAASHKFLASQIEAFTKDPSKFVIPQAPEAPPGMPIGMACGDWGGAWSN